MKSISACILIITLLWANALFAQTSGNASNQLLFVPEATCKIIYRGIKNPVSLVASDSKGSPTISSGKIYSGKIPEYEGEYIIEVTDPNVKEVIVSLNGMKQKFTVLNVPLPTITIGGYKSGENIPKAALNGTPRLNAVYDGGYFPYRYANCTVKSYSYIKETRGVVTAVNITGNTIPADIQQDISRKPSGATITFTDIKVSTPSGITNAPAYTLIVK